MSLSRKEQSLKENKFLPVLSLYDKYYLFVRLFLMVCLPLYNSRYSSNLITSKKEKTCRGWHLEHR